MAIERDHNIEEQEDEVSLLYIDMEELRIQYRKGEEGRGGNAIKKSQNMGVYIPNKSDQI